MMHTSPEASPENSPCYNCQITQFKIEILNAKLDELKAKCEASTDGHTSNLSKMLRRNAMVTAKGMIDWKVQCKHLEKKIKQLQEDAISEGNALLSEIEENQNEKDELKKQLHNVELKIAAQNEKLLKIFNEGVKLEEMKQNMEKRLRQRLEKQKIEVENALREKLMEMERQYELNTSEIVRYKAMLKKSHEENTELCYRWQRAAKLLEGIKFATTESENFQQRLEEKLGVLVKKFRNEANNSKTKMMTYVVDNFEAAMKVILSDEPNLHYFMQSNKDLTMVGNNELNKWSQITTENSSEKRKKSVKEEQKVLSDFKKFISNIDSLLKTFYQKQETELANSTSQIIGRVEKIKQTIKRAGDLNDILDVNKFISRVPQNILEEVKDMSDKFKILNKRMNEMSLEIGLRNDEEEKWRELIAEENKVMEACRKIDHEQQELEFILNRAELKYDQLYRQIYLGSNTVLEGSSRENIREFIED